MPSKKNRCRNPGSRSWLPLWTVLAIVACFTARGNTVHAQSTYLESLMYQGSAVAACIRHLRHGGSVGCQAEPGTTGILYMLSDQSDVAAFLADAPAGKYAVLMPYTILTRFVPLPPVLD
ncbi:hypothetical protein HDU86_003503 [Geranomyces michiganensis]|nr:hypothetical protein HDU86_003503 [Geranomyces michiganensis]